MTDRQFIPLNIAVLTVSDTRTEEDDRSGQLLAARLAEAGHRCRDKRIVADDIYRVRAALSEWIVDDGIQVVLCTGGTGITGRDGTPEAVVPLLDKTIGGFGEMFRTRCPTKPSAPRRCNRARSRASPTAPTSSACPARPARAPRRGTNSSASNWITARARATWLN